MRVCQTVKLVMYYANIYIEMNLSCLQDVIKLALNQNLCVALSVIYISGCLVECRICNWEVTGSNLGRSYFAPRSTQPSIPPGSLNEYHT